MYTRTQNINRPCSESDGEPPRKVAKQESRQKHSYPEIPPPNTEDDISNNRNKVLLTEELSKTEPDNDTMMSLMTRLFPKRRLTIVESDKLSVKKILDEHTLLKRTAYVCTYNYGILLSFYAG